MPSLLKTSILSSSAGKPAPERDSARELHLKYEMRDELPPGDLNEKDLVRRMQSGDEAAFEHFTRHHVPALYRFAIARLRGDRQLASDIVQTTLCKVLSKLGSFRGDGPLLGWLCGCCRNEIAMHFRSRPREVELDTEGIVGLGLVAREEDEPDHDLLALEASEVVHLVLDLIPEHYAQILEWKYVEGTSMREIGGRLEVSEKAVESLLTRARSAFRDAWNRHGGAAGATAARSEAR